MTFTTPERSPHWEVEKRSKRKAAKSITKCPACMGPWEAHTLRERRECRGRMGGRLVPTVAALVALLTLVACDPGSASGDPVIERRDGELLYIDLDDGRTLECVKFEQGSLDAKRGYLDCLWPEQRRPQ